VPALRPSQLGNLSPSWELGYNLNSILLPEYFSISFFKIAAPSACAPMGGKVAENLKIILFSAKVGTIIIVDKTMVPIKTNINSLEIFFIFNTP
jgi:hypothetical protein